MARHFGMRFAKDTLFRLNDIGDRYDPSANPVCTPWQLAQSTAGSFKGYIHADSLSLLEPQVGDLCESSNGVAEICEAAVSDKDIGGKVLRVIVVDGFFRLRSDVERIIQRGGLAFHSPESEDTNG